MAFNFYRENNNSMAENHEINVTPFIDVMLVLLIIFMVAAPLATVSIPVDLPAMNSSLNVPPADPVYLTVQKDFTIILGEGDGIALPELAEHLNRQFPDTQLPLFIRADEQLNYGQVMEVMNTINQAGYTKVALVALDKQH